MDSMLAVPPAQRGGRPVLNTSQQQGAVVWACLPACNRQRRWRCSETKALFLTVEGGARAIWPTRWRPVNAGGGVLWPGHGAGAEHQVLVATLLRHNFEAAGEPQLQPQITLANSFCNASTSFAQRIIKQGCIVAFHMHNFLATGRETRPLHYQTRASKPV